MITIGQRVKFLSDTGVGIVKSIRTGIAMVEVDGFEIPVQLSDIVAVDIAEEAAAVQRIGPSTPNVHTQKKSTQNASSNYGKLSLDNDWGDDEPVDVLALKRQYKATQQALSPDAEPTAPTPRKAPWEESDHALYLCFTPTDTKNAPWESDLELQLINDGTYDVFYSVSLWQRGNYVTTIENGRLEAGIKTTLRKFSRRDLTVINTLHIEALACKEGGFVPQTMTCQEVEMHPLKFVKERNFKATDFTDQPSILIPLATSSDQQD